MTRKQNFFLKDMLKDISKNKSQSHNYTAGTPSSPGSTFGFGNQQQGFNTQSYSPYASGGFHNQTPTGFAGAHNPYQGWDATAQNRVSTPQNFQTLTYEEVLAKAGISFGVCILTAVATFFLVIQNLSFSFAAMLAGFVALGLSFYMSFTSKYNSAPLTLLFSAFEGIFVGGFSGIVNSYYPQGTTAVVLAITGTLVSFGSMLALYRSGAVRVTPRFNRIILFSLFGILGISLASGLLSMFTHQNILRGNGTISIIFSVVCVVVAVAALLSDFDEVDSMVKAKAPASYAWGASFILLIGIVYVYLQILELLAKVLSRD